jgi:FimV-like protein
MPTRILIRLSLLAGLVAPLCAFALGVGPLEVRSALNQNFEAEIPLISSNPVELIGLTAQVPRQREFDWAGVERYEFLSKLRFSVQAPPGGPNVLKITSTEPLREPNFTLLLELAWPRGRLLRAFPVQLDPALYANRRLPPPPPPPPVMVPPPIAAEPAATAPPVPGLPPAPPVSFEGATSYGPVKSGETLMGIASQVRPSTTIKLPEMMAILVAGNSEAFVNGNPNVLRAGSVLKVPTPQALGVQGGPTPPVPNVAAAAPTESAPTQPQPPIEPQPVEPQPVEPTPTGGRLATGAGSAACHDTAAARGASTVTGAGRTVAGDHSSSQYPSNGGRDVTSAGRRHVRGETSRAAGTPTSRGPAGTGARPAATGGQATGGAAGRKRIQLAGQPSGLDRPRHDRAGGGRGGAIAAVAASRQTETAAG